LSGLVRIELDESGAHVPRKLPGGARVGTGEHGVLDDDGELGRNGVEPVDDRSGLLDVDSPRCEGIAGGREAAVKGETEPDELATGARGGAESEAELGARDALGRQVESELVVDARG